MLFDLLFLQDGYPLTTTREQQERKESEKKELTIPVCTHLKYHFRSGIYCAVHLLTIKKNKKRGTNSTQKR
jgi:hypothetical protein